MNEFLLSHHKRLRTRIFHELLSIEEDKEERVGVKDDGGDVESKNPVGDNDQVNQLADSVDDAEDDVEHVHSKPGPRHGCLLFVGTNKKNAANHGNENVEDKLNNLHCQPISSGGLTGVVLELVKSVVEV